VGEAVAQVVATVTVFGSRGEEPPAGMNRGVWHLPLENDETRKRRAQERRGGPPRTARTRVIRGGRCAGDFSPMFDLPDIVWDHYVPEPYRRHPVCIECWWRLPRDRRWCAPVRVRRADAALFVSERPARPGRPDSDDPCPTTAKRPRDLTIRPTRPAARGDQATQRHIRR
jgi:hypothetical protein